MVEISRFATDYYRIDRRGGRDLLVVFSHVDIPQYKFSQTGIFSNGEADILFLNCPGNSYYCRGVPGLGDSFDTTVARLGRIIDSGRYEKVAFFGNSMGGYGALNYGLELGVPVIALAPEALLGLHGGAAAKKMANPSLARGEVARFVVRAGLFGRGRLAPLHLVFGEIDFADAVCAAFLYKLLGTRPLVVPGGPHSLAPFLERNGGLAPFIASRLEGVRVDPVPSLLDDRVLIKLGYDAYVGERPAQPADNLREAYAGNVHFAHIRLRQLARVGLKPEPSDPALRTTNLLYHVAQFRLDPHRWAQCVNHDDIRSVASIYAGNNTLGDYHFFIASCLLTGLLSSGFLDDLNMQPSWIERVAAQAETLRAEPSWRGHLPKGAAGCSRAKV